MLTVLVFTCCEIRVHKVRDNSMKKEIRRATLTQVERLRRIQYMETGEIDRPASGTVAGEAMDYPCAQPPSDNEFHTSHKINHID